MTSRRTDLDFVRFLALISMYVAHVAPTPGPGRVLALSEYVTMPLFALVIGAGAQLAQWQTTAIGDRRHWWLSLGVRASTLVGLGLLLERAGTQVVIVLVHLGALVVVAALLARFPSVAVATVGIAAFVLTPLLLRQAQISGVPYGLGATSQDWVVRIELFLWAGFPYRLGSMVVYSTLGIVLARWWLGASRPSGGGPRLGGPTFGSPLLVGIAALAVAAVVFVSDRAGRLDVVPYSGTGAETLLDASLAVGVLGVGLSIAKVLPPLLARGLGAVGAMTLSLYALQIGWLAYDARVLHPGMRHDTWVNLEVLVAGSLIVATLWRFVVRPEPWRRGPLEGPLVALSSRSLHT